MYNPTFYYIVNLNKKLWGVLMYELFLKKNLLLFMTMLFVTMMILILL